MGDWKKILIILTILLATTGFSLSTEAARHKNVKPAAPQLPIVIEADTLHVNDQTGDLFADGNVVITQGENKVTTDHVDGNTQKHEIWIAGQAHMLQPGMDLFGNSAHYNYESQSGSMQEMHGMVNHQRVMASSIDFLPNKSVIHNGTVTRCPAKVPDYHVSATKVEIWPGDKMIIYNAKFWIKNTVIYSLPKYEKNLNKDAESDFPTVGYTNRDGFSIRQYLEYPLTDNVSAFAAPAYYSRIGFKPYSGFIDREKNYSLSLVDGNFRDANNNWIKKEPEIKLAFAPRPIGSSAITYSFTASAGLWKDDAIQSWHQDYLLYFAHAPIPLNPSMSLSLGTGVERIMESYDQSTHNGIRFDATLNKVFSPKLSAYMGYHHNTDSQTLFAFERADMSNEVDIGAVYKLDRLNAIGVSQSYDLAHNRIYDRDFTWYRNLHCWDMALTYRSKRHELHWDLSVVRW